MKYQYLELVPLAGSMLGGTVSFPRNGISYNLHSLSAGSPENCAQAVRMFINGGCKKSHLLCCEAEFGFLLFTTLWRLEG